jgi:hypothetical protein
VFSGVAEMTKLSEPQPKIPTDRQRES